MNNYLNFDTEKSPSGKTLVVYVISRKHHNTLGVIRWHGPWRQYALFPESETIWNPDCLDEINTKIRSLMQKRFEKQKARELPDA